MRNILTITLLLLVATGCRANRNQLVGKWQVQDKKGERVLTFNSDRSYAIVSTFEYEGRTNSVEMTGTYNILPERVEMGLQQLVLQGTTVEYRGPDKDKLKKDVSKDPDLVKFWIKRDLFFIYTHPGYPPLEHKRMK